MKLVSLLCWVKEVDPRTRYPFAIFSQILKKQLAQTFEKYVARQNWNLIYQTLENHDRYSALHTWESSMTAKCHKKAVAATLAKSLRRGEIDKFNTIARYCVQRSRYYSSGTMCLAQFTHIGSLGVDFASVHVTVRCHIALKRRQSRGKTEYLFCVESIRNTLFSRNWQQYLNVTNLNHRLTGILHMVRSTDSQTRVWRNLAWHLSRKSHRHNPHDWFWDSYKKDDSNRDGVIQETTDQPLKWLILARGRIMKRSMTLTRSRNVGISWYRDTK